MWGNKGGPFQSVRIAGCTGNPHTGNACAGGFYLLTPSACVPLTFTIGARRLTVRFGVGTHCN